MTRLLVAGGRDFDKARKLFDVLDKAHQRFGISLLIHGACPSGADKLADEWARSRGIPIRTFPADWDRHGRAAGPIRNEQMVKEGQPNLAVVFPGNAGTANVTKLLRKAYVRVFEVRPSEIDTGTGEPT